MKRSISRLLLVLAASCAGTAAPRGPAPVSAPNAPTVPAPVVQNVALADVGLDASKLDRTIKPCDDFYRFACGSWLDRMAIPADKSQYGTFNVIFDRNEALLHEILESAAKDPGQAPVLQKLGAFYATCMDEAALEKAGTSALAPLFALSAKVKDERSLLAALASLQRAGIDALFEFGPTQDKKDATQMIAQIGQGGLGLPDRDYYVNADEHSAQLREAYRAYIEKMFVLYGKKPAAAKLAAAHTLALETAIAQHHKTRVELRDEVGTYNRIDRAGLSQHAPLSWESYFDSLGFAGISSINTVSVPYVEAFATLAKSFPWPEWRDYLDARILDDLAAYLPKRFVDESFEMTRMLTGQKEQRPRWKRCISYTDKSLGELLAQPYVARAFAGGSKAAAERMTDGISRAFAANLPSVDWMDSETKTKALDKLSKIMRLIGYPERFRSYDFEVSVGQFTASALAAARFESGYQLSRIGKPVDKHEWQMTPPTVNAYYDPQLNEMVFPAGILQPPFYDVNASVAVNLGAMGMIVGHELTHGFDDQGSQYDGDGNMSGWWPQTVTKAFSDRTQCVASYYGHYEPLPGLRQNGQLTLGENIADMGGVKLAFAAYRAMRGPLVQIADGFTQDQQFFLAVGQAWCTKSTEQMERMRVTVDPHSTPRFRVIGSLSNLAEFAEAFQCPAGSGMRPAQTCKVW